MARKAVTPINLSFLDVMFCGFGAVVLLIVILNTNVLQKREEQSRDLRAALEHATALEDAARRRMAELNLEIEQVELKEGALQARAADIEAKIRATADKAQQAEAQAQAARGSIAALQAQSAALENALALLRAKTAGQWQGGGQPVGFSGDGQRQYLTGLKLGGERTVILLDSSASMLDETVVNVVRRKLMPPVQRQGAPKWQRTLRAFHWLLANMRPGRKFQVYRFDVDAAPLLPGTDGQWLSTDDATQIGAMLSAARALAPIGGTSFHRAFQAIGKMSPPPDSIIVLTDGLPTQGAAKEGDRTVTSEERLRFFRESLRLLPSGVAVNTLLFPMEGDPLAAGAFWQLAISTRGSFITPSRDWP